MLNSSLFRLIFLLAFLSLLMAIGLWAVDLLSELAVTLNTTRGLHR